MKDRWTIGFVVILPVLILSILHVVQDWSWVQYMEWKTADKRFQTRNAFEDYEPPKNLCLIAIDDESTNGLGRWPFPRTIHAALLDELSKSPPDVLAWDILFVDDDPLPEIDQIFSKSTQPFHSFISSAVLGPRNETQTAGATKPFKYVSGDISLVKNDSQAQIPISGLTTKGYFGFVNCDPMLDGVRRFCPMIYSWNGDVYPSLALQIILRHFDINPDLVIVNLGREIIIPGGQKGPEIKIPINKRGDYFLNMRRKVNDWYGASYVQLAKSLEENNALKDDQNPLKESLKNSICLFGLTATGHGDTGANALSTFEPLVNLHLNTIANVLQNDYVRIEPPRFWIPFLFFAFLFLTAFMVYLPFYWSMILGLLFFPIHYFFSVAWLIHQHTLVPVAAPELGIGLCLVSVISFRYLREESDKRFIKRSLGAYLSKKVLKEVLNNPDEVHLGGSKKEITVLFCDIRSFTTYCEKRDPDEVLRVLNDYLQFMTEVILKYDGTLDKYIGDGIMAFWGAPQDQPDHAQRAVCAAVEMRYAISKFRSKQASQGDALFECGIGVHTGEALVGNVGSKQHINYTAIGSTVNLAARLETLTKVLPARILISEPTQKQLSDGFVITALGEVTLKGFTEPTKVYSVEAAQDLEAALSVTKSLKKLQESEVLHPLEPVFKPVPIPDDD